MYGAIYGDIVGSIYEYNQTKVIKSINPDTLITKESFYSDDTILTIAILDAILGDKNYDWATNLILYSLYDVNAHLLYAFDIKTREDWIGYFQDKDIVMWHDFFKRRKEALR